MADAYQCDLCNGLFEDSPPNCPIVEYQGSRITIAPTDAYFTTGSGTIHLDVCPACQEIVLRLLAGEVQRQANE